MRHLIVCEDQPNGGDEIVLAFTPCGGVPMEETGLALQGSLSEFFQEFVNIISRGQVLSCNLAMFPIFLRD